MSLIVTGEHSWGVCDWGCGREADLIEVAVDGRVYQVCEGCLAELRDRFEEEE